jgi:A/G-specific adenine glycosylase
MVGEMIAAEPLPSPNALLLMEWAATGGRRMPWRDTADPYAIAVAEVLLQKTRADAALQVWSRLLAAYPEPDALAEASEEEVTAIVSHLGLGRQRSARLIAMARALESGSASMPGIGPYGAGVLALSRDEQPADAPVDGNIARVVSRVHGLAFDRGELRKKAEVKERVRSMLDAGGAARDQLRVLYALVDLGATVCTPRSPRCTQCPLQGACRYAESSRAS